MGPVKNKTGKKRESSQGCITRGLVLWSPGFDFVENLLWSYRIWFKLCIEWPKWRVLSTGSHTVVKDGSWRGTELSYSPSLQWDASEWYRMAEKVPRVSYRRQLSSPHRKWDTSGTVRGVPSGFTWTTLDTTAIAGMNAGQRNWIQDTEVPDTTLMPSP